MTIPDIASLKATELLALKASIDERLAVMKQQHITAAGELGLKLVEGQRKARKPRNGPPENENNV